MPLPRVVHAAAGKGVTLEVRQFSRSTHTAEDLAAAVGAELRPIVKALLFVAPRADGSPEALICLSLGPYRVDRARLARVVGEPDLRPATASGPGS